MKKIALLLSLFFGLNVYSQTLSDIQQQNARATGYAIIASKNPGVDFGVMVIPWDGTGTLEYNANTQINASWHAQAAIKGNFFGQAFDGSNFSGYSSVVTSEAQFDLYKSNGIQWWIVCSTLPAFSSGYTNIQFTNDYSDPSTAPNKISLWNGGANNYFGFGISTNNLDYISQVNHRFYTGYNGSPGVERMVIAGTGNVGIGDPNPQTNLSIMNNGQQINFIVNKKLTGQWPPEIEDRTITIQSSGNSSGNLAFATGNDERVRISANGNMGIGTATPQFKLDVIGKSSFSDNMAVQGKIESKEVKVTTTPTADYVFEESYALPSLESVEKHIKEKKHLPEIASAKEMKKEGVNIGEFQIKLLQKIEELTLYTIEQNKQLIEQNKKITRLEQDLQAIKEKNNQ